MSRMGLFVKGLISGLIGFLVYQVASFGLGLTVYTAREDDPLVTVLLLAAVLGNGLMIGGAGLLLDRRARRQVPDALAR